MFIGFANFYQPFIQGFSKIAALLTSILKITKSFEELALKTLSVGDNEVVRDGDRANETVVD